MSESPPEYRAQTNSAPLTAHAPEVRENAFNLFQVGRDYTDISCELSIPVATIRGWAKRDNWKTRLEMARVAPGLEAGLSNTLAKVVERIGSPAIDGANADLTEQQAQYDTGSRAQALRVPHIMAAMTDRELVSAADKLAKLDAIARKALKLETEKASAIISISLLSTPSEKQVAALDI